MTQLCEHRSCIILDHVKCCWSFLKMAPPSNMSRAPALLSNLGTSRHELYPHTTCYLSNSSLQNTKIAKYKNVPLSQYHSICRRANLRKSAEHISIVWSISHTLRVDSPPGVGSKKEKMNIYDFSPIRVWSISRLSGQFRILLAQTSIPVQIPKKQKKTKKKSDFLLLTFEC